MRLRSLLAAAALSAAALVAAPTLADGPAWPDVSGSPSGIVATGAKDAAVIVALEEYFVLPKVAGASRNATDWYVFLTEARKIPDDRVHMLRDKAATKEAILDAVKKARGEVKPGGTLWFLFIGHGAPSEDGKDGYLVGADAQQTASGIYTRSVAQSELAKVLEPQGGGHSIAILDACFSGRTGSGAAVAEGLQPLVVLKDNPGRLGKVTWLSAGAPNEFAGPLPGVARPAFSYLVLGAMRGWGDSNGDGKITASEAVSYARRTLNVLPLGRSQTPDLSGPDPDLPLSEGAKEAGPKLRDLLPPVTPNTPPPPPEPPHAPGALQVTFLPRERGEHWRLMKGGAGSPAPLVDKNLALIMARAQMAGPPSPAGRASSAEPVCDLPCTYWVPPASGFFLQLDASKAEDIKTVQLPIDLGYTVGTKVDAKPRLDVSYGRVAGGFALIAAGIALLAGGVVLAVSPPEGTGWGTPAAFLVVLGLGGLGGGAALAVYGFKDRPYAVDLTLHESGTSARVGPGFLSIATSSGTGAVVTPMGALGTF